MRKNQHVVPKDGQWAVRGDGNRKATRVFQKQTDAIGHARALARSIGSELVIHGQDGRIREKNTYGRDPLPSKG